MHVVGHIITGMQGRGVYGVAVKYVSRQSHRRASSSSNTASTSAPRRSREASRTTHSPDIRPSTTLEARLPRQQHQRASRSEDLPRGTSSNYGFSQATGTRTFSAYQSPEGFQQTEVPRAPSLQTPPVQQQPYYGGYTNSDAAPSVPATSRQDDSTSTGSSESSEDEYADDRGSPYWGSRRQFRDVVASVAARGNAEPAQRQRSHHGSASGGGVYEPPANPSQERGRPSSSSNRRSTSNTSNAVAGSGRLPRTEGPILPSPAVSLPRHMAAPIQYQQFRPSSPLPPPSQQLAPGYQFLRVILRVDPIQHTVNQADRRIDIKLQEQHRVSGQ
ncbi:Uncharacterized protein HZ326_19928 [Fusarium oxysporum f. sp. albedinis]|nr:Uncharacterized protein HZ326_19928 [Fusarium oxysporum f. sp. albedinis]